MQIQYLSLLYFTKFFVVSSNLSLAGKLLNIKVKYSKIVVMCQKEHLRVRVKFGIDSLLTPLPCFSMYIFLKFSSLRIFCSG